MRSVLPRTVRGRGGGGLQSVRRRRPAARCLSHRSARRPRRARRARSSNETVQRNGRRASARRPTDAAAAIRLADALLRQARVLATRAWPSARNACCGRCSRRIRDQYDARRMLTTVLLSQHRFRDAIREAERCLQMRRDAAWPYGVIGDARLELGEYDAAFAAFDRMTAAAARRGQLRPRRLRSANSRAICDGAIRLMTMALEATSPNDPEALAWHHAQLGGLHLRKDASPTQPASSRTRSSSFPVIRSPPRAARASPMRAATMPRRWRKRSRLIAQAPTPWILAFSADQLRALGRAAEADRHDAQAEAAWRTDAPDPARLALFLAQRGRQARRSRPHRRRPRRANATTSSRPTRWPGPISAPAASTMRYARPRGRSAPARAIVRCATRAHHRAAPPHRRTTEHDEPRACASSSAWQRQSPSPASRSASAR